MPLISHRSSAITFATDLLAWALFLTVAHAQSYRWEIVDVWKDHFAYGVECGRSGACFAAATYRLEVATIVRKSDDCGRTWYDALRLDASSERWPLRMASIQAVGSRSVFAGMDMGVIAASEDAGETWEFRRAHDTGWVLELHMYDVRRGVALVEILHAQREYSVTMTTDGWRSWRELPLPDSIRFTDTVLAHADVGLYPTDVARTGEQSFHVVFRAGEATSVARTTDEGATWRFNPLGEESIVGVRFADSLSGWAYGGRLYRFWGDSLPAVFRTTDGGTTWDLALVGSRINDLNYRGSDVVAVADEQRVYSSSDGGVTWRRDSAYIRGAVIPYVALPDSGDAIIVTSWGDVLQSKGIPSKIVPEPQERLTPALWIEESQQSLVVEYAGRADHIEVRLYAVSGELVASLPPVRNSPNASFSLGSLDLPAGRYVATVAVEGRIVRSVPLILYRE